MCKQVKITIYYSPLLKTYDDPSYKHVEHSGPYQKPSKEVKT